MTVTDHRKTQHGNLMEPQATGDNDYIYPAW